LDARAEPAVFLVKPAGADRYAGRIAAIADATPEATDDLD
jgi:hypothetical protein